MELLTKNPGLLIAAIAVIVWLVRMEGRIKSAHEKISLLKEFVHENKADHGQIFNKIDELKNLLIDKLGK